MVNYVTATTHRLNNYNYLNSRAPVSNLTNGTDCYAYAAETSGRRHRLLQGRPARPVQPLHHQGTFRAVQRRASVAIPAPPARFRQVPRRARPAPLPADVSWATKAINDVTPTFTAGRSPTNGAPTKKLDVSLALNMTTTIPPGRTPTAAAKNFWFAAAQQEYCYNPLTFQPVFVPQQTAERVGRSITVRHLQLPGRPLDRYAGANRPSRRPQRPRPARQPVSVDYTQTYWQPRSVPPTR